MSTRKIYEKLIDICLDRGIGFSVSPDPLFFGYSVTGREVRIAPMPNSLLALYSLAHEVGHAMTDASVPYSWATPWTLVGADTFQYEELAWAWADNFLAYNGITITPDMTFFKLTCLESYLGAPLERLPQYDDWLTLANKLLPFS